MSELKNELLKMRAEAAGVVERIDRLLRQIGPSERERAMPAPGSMDEILLNMLRRKEGATLPELEEVRGGDDLTPSGTFIRAREVAERAGFRFEGRKDIFSPKTRYFAVEIGGA